MFDSHYAAERTIYEVYFFSSVPTTFHQSDDVDGVFRFFWRTIYTSKGRVCSVANKNPHTQGSIYHGENNASKAIHQTNFKKALDVAHRHRDQMSFSEPSFHVISQTSQLKCRTRYFLNFSDFGQKIKLCGWAFQVNQYGIYTEFQNLKKIKPLILESRLLE